jgi:hypothetical protein
VDTVKFISFLCIYNLLTRAWILPNPSHWNIIPIPINLPKRPKFPLYSILENSSWYCKFILAACSLIMGCGLFTVVTSWNPRTQTWSSRLLSTHIFQPKFYSLYSPHKTLCADHRAIKEERTLEIKPTTENLFIYIPLSIAWLSWPHVPLFGMWLLSPHFTFLPTKIDLRPGFMPFPLCWLAIVTTNLSITNQPKYNGYHCIVHSSSCVFLATRAVFHSEVDPDLLVDLSIS